ncbi:MAG: DedA family protein [Holosporaceae bacterium]|nr:DedA family protein [Holosporaceae bacterium]
MFESFIHSYGYYAVFLFSCIEGEIAVLTAGFLCHRGMMALEWVMFFAFLGTFITEQCLFFVGRTYGTRLLEQHPRLSQKASNAIAFLRKYNTVFIFGSRFVYGIRNISPMIIGMAKITPLRFSSLNVPAAIIWSVLVAGAGYVFADILESVKANMQYLQLVALALLLLGVVGYFLLWKKRDRTRPEDKNE